MGLEIHDALSIGKRPSTLGARHAVIVEPGLYYLGLGGFRIEDLAAVTPAGSGNLTRVPKLLEIDAQAARARWRGRVYRCPGDCPRSVV